MQIVKNWKKELFAQEKLKNRHAEFNPERKIYYRLSIQHHPSSLSVLKIHQKKIKPVLQLKSAEKCVESWILFNVPLSQSSQFIFIVGHASGIKINLNLCKKFSLLNLNVFKIECVKFSWRPLYQPLGSSGRYDRRRDGHDIFHRLSKKRLVFP